MNYYLVGEKIYTICGFENEIRKIEERIVVNSPISSDKKKGRGAKNSMITISDRLNFPHLKV
jgi:hypothetical protein